MSARKTILILCDWFLPGFLAGGPIQSIATLTEQLGKDIDFKIITTDRDFKSEQPYNDVKVNVWTQYKGRTVYYISPENMNADFVLKLIQGTPHHVIYMNSLYSKLFTIYPLKWKLQKKINSKIILAPRGMLGDGALAIKAFKKQLFLMYAKAFGLFKDIVWQSTSVQETSEINKRIGYSSKIFEASNLPHIAYGAKGIEKQIGQLKLCFISRISKKKNLNFAIEILKSISVHEIIFDVYGPIEDETYWNICQQNVKLLSKNIKFHYNGILKHTDISKTIAQYHSLFLPTQNENYGHIIVETLQNARPVLISDQTPWRNLQKENVGFDIPLSDKTKFVEAIKSLCDMNQSEFDTMSEACVSYINRELNVEEIKTKYLELFNS